MPLAGSQDAETRTRAECKRASAQVPAVRQGRLRMKMEIAVVPFPAASGSGAVPERCEMRADADHFWRRAEQEARAAACARSESVRQARLAMADHYRRLAVAVELHELRRHRSGRGSTGLTRYSSSKRNEIVVVVATGRPSSVAGW
jgi:hypothetical protein